MAKLRICPICLEPTFITDKDYVEGEIKPVTVLISYRCGHIITNKVLRNASLSNIQRVRARAGVIAKRLGLKEEHKKEVFNLIKEIKRQHPKMKDYKVLELAFNEILKKYGYTF
jgi:hypothetical protein